MYMNKKERFFFDSPDGRMSLGLKKHKNKNYIYIYICNERFFFDSPVGRLRLGCNKNAKCNHCWAIFLYVCIYVYTFICMYACMNEHMYVCMHVCMCALMLPLGERLPRLTSQQRFFAPGIRAHIAILAFAENVPMRCLKEFTLALDHETHLFGAHYNFFISIFCFTFCNTFGVWEIA